MDTGEIGCQGEEIGTTHRIGNLRTVDYYFSGITGSLAYRL